MNAFVSKALKSNSNTRYRYGIAASINHILIMWSNRKTPIWFIWYKWNPLQYSDNKTLQFNWTKRINLKFQRIYRQKDWNVKVYPEFTNQINICFIGYINTLINFQFSEASSTHTIAYMLQCYGLLLMWPTVPKFTGL